MVKETVSVAEAAVLLGLSQASTYAAVQNGEIPSIRIGSRWLIPRRGIDEMLGGSAAETSAHSEPDADAA